MKTIYLKFLFILTSNLLFSQIAINTTGNFPDSSAGLDIAFTDKGVLIPRISLLDTNLTTPITNPAIGLLIFNTTINSSLSKGFYYWNGIKWVKLVTIEETTKSFWNLHGNSGTDVNSNFLGTVDSVGISIRTNNIEYIFISPSGKIGVGTNNPKEQLHLTKNLRIPKTSSTNEGVIYVDSLPFFHNYGDTNLFIGTSSGNFNLIGNNNIAIGDSSQYFLQNGSLNISIGKNSLKNNFEGINNIAIGYNSLYNDSSGSNNTAVGVRSLMWNRKGNFNTSVGYESAYSSKGSLNTSVGTQSLYSNENGAQNIAVGFQSAYTNLSGSYNVAIGQRALYSNQIGNNNVAIGNRALYGNTVCCNLAVGHNAMDKNTTGTENTAIGYVALYNNTVGKSNTSLGYFSMYNSNSDNNTALGAYSLSHITTQSSNTALGFRSGSYYRFNQSTFIGCESYPNNHDYVNSAAFGYLSRATASNQVRIGNTAIISIGGFVDWTNLSDERFKIKTNDEVKGLEFILNLKPIVYTLNTESLSKFIYEESSENFNEYKINLDKKASVKYTGFSAQQVLEVAKACNYNFSGVDIPQNENDLYGLRYATFVVPLVKAVQELHTENQKLKEKIIEIENKLK